MMSSLRFSSLWRVLLRLVATVLLVAVLTLAGLYAFAGTYGVFSLKRLADFLRAAPLDLAIALNLGSGPVACQRIALNGLRRDPCGRWELAGARQRPAHPAVRGRTPGEIAADSCASS